MPESKLAKLSEEGLACYERMIAAGVKPNRAYAVAIWR